MDNRHSDFHKYTSQELAGDESFQAYAFKSNLADIEFWENFRQNHPEKQRDIDDALELLTLVSFRKMRTSPEMKKTELTRLLSSLEVSADEVAAPGPGEKMLRRWPFHRMAYRIAAVFAGLLIVASAVYYSSTYVFRGETIAYQAGYGQNITLTLPDSSAVILNGNSRLVYKDNSGGRKTREVWLEGEAFFDVRHRGDSDEDRFIVHIPGMTVEVLGTQFNVFNRDDKANVVLNSGKVKLNITASGDTSTVLMAPQEAVEYSRKDHTIVKRQVNAETLTSWRNKVWVFENTPLQKIAEMIEYNFGVETTFGSDVDPNEQLVGTVPSENLDILVAVLSKTSNLHVIRNGSRILITKNNPTSIEP